MTIWLIMTATGEIGPLTEGEIQTAIREGRARRGDTLISPEARDRRAIESLFNTDILRAETAGPRPPSLWLLLWRALWRALGYALLGIALLLAATYSWRRLVSPDFSDEDISAVRSSIRQEFEKRDGVSVVDVSMLREAPRKLTGFVRLKIGPLDLSKSCSATMDSDGRQYLWRCE